MRTIKNPQDGIRVKIVLELTNKLKMVEIETDSRIDVKKWNKQFELWCSHLFINQKSFHHHLDNFVSYPLIYKFVGIGCVLTELHTENWKHRSRWTVTLTPLLYSKGSVSSPSMMSLAYTCQPASGFYRDSPDFGLSKPSKIWTSRFSRISASK